MGIEPTLFAWEAKVLPLNYTRDGLIIEVAWFPSAALRCTVFMGHEPSPCKIFLLWLEIFNLK